MGKKFLFARSGTHPIDRALWGRSVSVLLLFIHALLLVWAVIGLVEWFVSDVPWPRLSNPLFPRWLLLFHWLAILTAATIFLAGFVARWRYTPAAMIAAYGFMAAVCAIETFGYMTHSLRFVAMTAEYAVYVAIVIVLYRLPGLADRFSVNRRGLGNETRLDEPLREWPGH